MPRRKSMGFMPAATDLQPSDNIARVRTVAVVVPANGQELYVVSGVTSYSS